MGEEEQGNLHLGRVKGELDKALLDKAGLRGFAGMDSSGGHSLHALPKPHPHVSSPASQKGGCWWPGKDLSA